jgi:hypothetical protein
MTAARNDILDGLLAEGASPDEAKSTQKLVAALREHRHEISGESRIPREDKAFSETVRREAARRSAEISGYHPSTGRIASAKSGKPVPWWLFVAWGAAIAAAVWIFLLN